MSQRDDGARPPTDVPGAMPAPTLSVRALNRATLARQLLLARSPLSVPDAVGALAGMQAQVPKPPFVGLWTRLDGFGAADLAAAIHRRELVRATAFRGTLHLMTRGDWLAFRPVLQPMLSAGMQSVLKNRSEGFDLDAVLEEARAFLAERAATFEEIRTHLAARFPAANDRALGYAVRMHLPLVMVPSDAAWAFPADAAFTLGEPWLAEPLGTALDPAPLVRRTLAAFGPASVKDAQTWSGLSGLKPVFEALRPELVVFRDDRGRELFDLPDAPRPDPETPAPARFLPEFDNLVLAHDDRSRIVADVHRGRLVTKNLRIPGSFLVDGFVAGLWSTERKKGVATLTLDPFAPLADADREALVREGEALVRFLEPEARGYEVR